jgi:hypothetical protein
VPIKDPDIFQIVEKIGDHYMKNISNRFMRAALRTLELPQSEWERLESLTSGAEYHRAQGFQFDELYEMILAAAHLISQARAQIVPSLRPTASFGGAARRDAADRDRVLRDMATQNFPVNLGILADLVNELYVKTANIDRQFAGKRTPVYERIPELKDLGRLLVSS